MRVHAVPLLERNIPDSFVVSMIEGDLIRGGDSSVNLPLAGEFGVE